jgi:CBS domain-containing protein
MAGRHFHALLIAAAAVGLLTREALALQSSCWVSRPATARGPATRFQMTASAVEPPKKPGILKTIKNFVKNDPASGGPIFRDLKPKQKASARKFKEWAGSSKPVSEYMKTDIITVLPQATLEEAGKVLADTGIAGAPVVDECGVLMGVLSRKDLLFSIAGRGALKESGGARSERYVENTKKLRKAEAGSVYRAMTPFPISLKPTATMQEAAALMLRRNLNRVLVTDPDSEKLVGIVSSTDVFKLAYGCDGAKKEES